MQRGYMIAVEGADKAGKHTQVVKIVDYLKSKNIFAETLDFPQYDSFFGKMITNYLNGDFGTTYNLPAEYTMLPYALDRLKFQPLIKKWLDEGKWIVLDRYSYSNCFSVAKCPSQEWGEKISFMEKLEFDELGIRPPDYNIYLSVDPKIAFNMRTKNLKQYQNGRADIHERNLDLLSNVSKVYTLIARENPTKWTVIDEMKSDKHRMNIEEVFSHIYPVLDKLIRQQLQGQK